MSYTNVTLGDLTRTKQSVSQFVSHMDSQMRSATQIVSGMSTGVWAGKDYQEYFRKWNQLSGSTSVFMKYKNELNYFSNFLGYVRTRYETAQSHAKTMFSRL